MKFNTLFNVVPRLRRSGTIPLIPLYKFMVWREQTLTLLGKGCSRFVTHFCSWYEKSLKSTSMRVSSNVPVIYRQRQPFHCVHQRMLHVWNNMSILRQEYT